MSWGLEFDYVIIGGGHNGLVASIVLARHGARVVVLEANNKLGGESSDAVYKGTRYPRVAYAIGLFPEDLAGYLGIDLDEISVLPDPSWIVLSDGEVSFRWWVRSDKLEEEFRRHSALEGYRRLSRLMELFSECAREKGILYTIDPPSLEVLEDLLNECDEDLGSYATMKWSEGLGGLIPVELWGLFNYPAFYEEPGYTGLYFNMNRGIWRQPYSGMDSLIELLAEKAKSLGVEIILGKRVDRIIVKNGTASGVELLGGARIRARRGILLSANILCLWRLVDEEELDKSISEDVRFNLAILREYKAPVTRVNFFHEGSPPYPVKDYSIKGYPILSIETGSFWGEAAYPTLIDNSLVGQRGIHVVTFTGLAPDVKPEDIAMELGLEKLVGYEQVSPGVLENDYCNITGDPNHIPMLGQFILDKRPFPGWGGYRTPIKGLYHGAASSHPGGQITGIPGHNAAIAMLVDAGLRPRTPLIPRGVLGVD